MQNAQPYPSTGSFLWETRRSGAPPLGRATEYSARAGAVVLAAWRPSTGPRARRPRGAGLDRLHGDRKWPGWPLAVGARPQRGAGLPPWGLEKPQRGVLGCGRRSRQPRGNWSGLSGLGAAEAAGRRMRGASTRAAHVSQPEPLRADIATACRGLVGCRAPGHLSAEAAGSRALAAGCTGAPARARPRECRVRAGTLKGASLILVEEKPMTVNPMGARRMESTIVKVRICGSYLEITISRFSEDRFLVHQSQQQRRRTFLWRVLH